ncbi:MAG: efflux RND transporter periplasmic adaptor subunit [Rhizobacter sp.]
MHAPSTPQLAIARFPLPTGRPALALALALLLAACSRVPTPAAPRGPVEVGVHVVEPQRQVITTELPGRTAARLVAEIRPQVGGIVQQRLFEEGSQVRAGQVLYQLDPASFAASHASAKAGVARAEATLRLAEVTARRNGELARIDAISQQVNEDSQAVVQQVRADLGVAMAALDAARVNLDRTRITAPIAGRVDTSTVTAGALVTANQAEALTTVQQLDPLYVDVTQSSAELLRLKRDLASGALRRVAGGSADDTPIRLLLEDGSAYAHPGVLKVSGVTVNAGTGSVTLRAVVPNPERLLLPGMYVRAVLELGVVEQALLVPQQGITRAPSGSAIALVVTADNRVERRPITVDRAIGSRWQVTQGLRAGDRVIVDGLQRIKVGDTVKPVPVAASIASSPAGVPASAVVTH